MLLKKISFCALFTVVSAISSDQQLLNLIPATATMTQAQINNSEVKKITIPGDDNATLKTLFDQIVEKTVSNRISHCLLIENNVAFGLLKSSYHVAPNTSSESFKKTFFQSKANFDRAIEIFFK